MKLYQSAFVRTCQAFLFVLVMSLIQSAVAQSNSEGMLRLARIKYGGGGDWYNDPSAIPNLAQYIARNTAVHIAAQEDPISLMDESLFSYPFLFMTGHGKILLDEREIGRLRDYLMAGGFLYCDDDYGLDTPFRSIIERTFPGKELIELPFSHPIYHSHFSFPRGLPKIHEHDNNAPRGYGLFDDDGRLMVFYTYETNISDGWADADVHKDTPEKREQALRMGVNIVVYALMH